jgi:hypothetical protein
LKEALRIQPRRSGEAVKQVAGLDGVSQFEAIRRFLQREVRS